MRCALVVDSMLVQSVRGTREERNNGRRAGVVEEFGTILRMREC